MLDAPAPVPPDYRDALALARPRLTVLGRDLRFYARIGSTNDLAASLAGTGDGEGCVVVADAQTAGRGRRGRRWHSPPVGGLYVSVVLTPARCRRDPARASMLVTLMAGVAIAEGVEAASGMRADLKWPNDLLLGGRKLAGILAEGVASSQQPSAIAAVVVGYGINVGPMALPPALVSTAITLEQECGRPVDRGTVLAETLAALERRYHDLLAGRFDAILDAWRERAPGAVGRRVSWTVPAGQQTGLTAGIADDGALLVQTASGTERIVAGEVQWA